MCCVTHSIAELPYLPSFQVAKPNQTHLTMIATPFCDHRRQSLRCRESRESLRLSRRRHSSRRERLRVACRLRGAWSPQDHEDLRGNTIESSPIRRRVRRVRRAEGFDPCGCLKRETFDGPWVDRCISRTQTQGGVAFFGGLTILHIWLWVMAPGYLG